MFGWYPRTLTLAALVLLSAACNGELDTVDREALVFNNSGADAGVQGSGPGEGDASGGGGEDGEDGGGGEGDASGGGEDGGAMPTLPPEVDPNCIDGMYTEALPDPSVDVSTEVAAYQSPQALGFVDAVLKKRFPLGAWLTEVGQSTSRGNCVEAFLGMPATADEAVSRLSTLVHECGHFYDLSIASGDDDAYAITESLTITCGGGDTTARGGDTFARSRIAGDPYAALRPVCSTFARGCDFYGHIYLAGDPDDASFQSGDQGFNSVLEETLQYVNALGTYYGFQDFLGSSQSSALDGILTFLWYTERFLRMARLDYPQAYERLTGDPCWREAILTIWGRAWLFIAAAEGNASLGIDDEQLFELVRDPELLEEIQRVRDAEGCGG